MYFQTLAMNNPNMKENNSHYYVTLSNKTNRDLYAENYKTLLKDLKDDVLSGKTCYAHG